MRNRRASTTRDTLVFLTVVTIMIGTLFVVIAGVCTGLCELKRRTNTYTNVDSICPSCATCHDGVIETTVRDGWIPERIKNYEK